MKKVILGALVIAGGPYSCNKSTDANNPTLKYTDPVMKANTGHTRMLQSSGTYPVAIYSCSGLGIDCGGDKKVAPAHAAAIEGFTQQGADFVQLFMQNDAVLSTYFGASTVQGVISGTLSLEVSGNLETTMFFIFREGENGLMVTPLVK